LYDLSLPNVNHHYIVIGNISYIAKLFEKRFSRIKNNLKKHKLLFHFQLV
jgi:hypothetical protein